MLGYKNRYLRVHPLSGGLEAWGRKGFPVEPVVLDGGQRASG
jgi:hypothetical protein